MKHYRLLVKHGHAGTGRYIERVLIVEARSIVEAWRKAKHAAGVKKGPHYLITGNSILKVELVSR